MPGQVDGARAARPEQVQRALVGGQQGGQRRAFVGDVAEQRVPEGEARAGGDVPDHVGAHQLVQRVQDAGESEP